MRLYEYEAKKIFNISGIPIPQQYGIISSPEELRGLSLKYPIMLKSSVLIGGRGKAGGIKKADNLDMALTLSSEIFKKTINGYPVKSILVEEVLPGQSFCYLGVTMNPGNFNNVFIASASGGVDIEEIAKTDENAIFKEELSLNEKILPEDVNIKIVEFLNTSLKLNTEIKNSLKTVISKLFEVYQKYDCKVCEINPLIVSEKGAVAADAKIVLDDNALYRQKELLEILGIKGKRHDVAELTPNELRAAQAGFSYVDLLPVNYKKDPEKLHVGLVPGGAGYGIFSIDEVMNIGARYFNDKVVAINFMDSGGGPTLSKVAEMFHLLMDYSVTDIIITSRFGGISSCDIFIRGLIDCLRTRFNKGLRMVPVYGRMVGTDLPSAAAYLEKSKTETPEALEHLDIIVGNQIIMADVIYNAIKKAFDLRTKKSEAK